MAQRKIYVVERYCENCETLVNVEIPHGKNKDEFFEEQRNKKKKCKRCGCRFYGLTAEEENEEFIRRIHGN